MKTESSYLVALKDWKGQYQEIRYILDDDFFAGLQDAEIKQGRVEALVEVRRIGDAFQLDMFVEGDVKLVCDRCLELMNQHVVGEGRLMVTYDELPQDAEDEWQGLQVMDEGVDVAWPLYETVALAVPLQHVHEDGACNEEMLKLISGCGAKESEKASDPRWDQLKNLIQNN